MPGSPRLSFRLLLPLLIVVAFGATLARVQDARYILKTLVLEPVSPVQAEEGKPAQEKETKKEPTHATSAPPPALAPNAKKETAETELYNSLAGRRDQLDARAKTLDARESLVVVAEKRIEQKMREMETLRAQLQALLGQASAGQAAQIENLVKIYETMKPKEAARIFETLEMPVLLHVIQRMKPARTAAVMAEMDPLRAKEITVALTRQDQLPQNK